MRRGFSTTTKFLIVIAVFGSIAGAIWLARASGSTQIASTLKLSSGPGGLADGLVGHWTFDGEDMPQGQVNDVSGNGNHGSQRNMSTSTAYTGGVLGQALNFDGSNDFVVAPAISSLNGVGVFAISFWAKSTVYGPSPAAVIINGTGDATDTLGIYPFDNSNGNGVRVNGCGADLVDRNSDSLADNTYHFFSLVSRSATSRELFIDGVSANTSASSCTLPNTIEITDIGHYTGFTQFFMGSLDDVRVYNRALSADEVKHLYQLGATTRIATTPSQSNTGTGLNAGLVGHWTFDGKNMPNGQVNDISGNGNHGSMLNMPTSTAFVAGAIGQSLFFNGNNSRINIGDTSSLDISGDQITLSAWVYDDGTSNINGHIMGKVVSSHNYRLAVNQSNQSIDMDINTGGLASCQKPGGAGGLNFMHKQWNHVLGVYDGAEMRIYVNGSQRGASCADAGNITPNNDGFAIGDRGAATNSPFPGKIDDVRVYNRALSPDEIKQLYQLGATTKIATTPSQSNTGTGLNAGLVGHWTFDGKNMPNGQVNDVSGNGNHGSQSGTATSTAYVGGVLGQAIDFDGSNDVIRIGDNDALDFGANQDYTLSVWVKQKRVPVSFDSFFMKDDNGSPRNSYILNYTADNVWAFTQFANGTQDNCSNVSLRDGRWHHIVGMRRGSQLFGYTDGVQTCNDASASTASLANTANLGIGARPADTNSPGLSEIDDVRIYNRALSTDEVKQLYQMGR